MSNEKFNTIKPAKDIASEIKDMVQTYTDVMAFPDRKKLREIDSKDIKDYVLPKQDEINGILKATLNLIKDKDEKEKVQKCIELNETIKDHLNQLVKDDFDMEQINSEVKGLWSMIYRLVRFYE
ncbi:hypothetical protein [Alkaliphilus serpentinus]|uniref:Uncharacterized protein n=1 Tax=Alkaliphilus serpentinus TaxID=1482731 RepID=A0A833HM20_9FIRM|nr:hypothetical protein [Alkaliphilus serpentinus]KAB3527118.1 hypothetical protein F8153_13180 [Alkaliphilus serpentinus]